jgi:SAM-dependent methyltransferase
MQAYLAASHYNDPAVKEAFWHARRSVLAWIVDRFLADLPANATVVDFGAGFGYLRNVLRERGHSCTVIDVERNPRARLAAAPAGTAGQSVSALEDLAPLAGTIDALVAIDSLYYLEAPRAVIERMASLLRAGGRFVMRNTSGEFRWLAHRFMGRPDVLGDGCWGFTVSGMDAAIRAAGLEATGIQYLEGARGRGQLGLYYLISGLVTAASAGRIAVSPGWVMTAIKPAR